MGYFLVGIIFVEVMDLSYRGAELDVSDGAQGRRQNSVLLI